MPDEINFFDLASLLKIKPDTTMERFGGMLNSSYFDGANIAATLSQKKLISFNTALPGQSIITITDTGKQLIDEANTKANMDFDHLDLAVITQVSNGKTTPNDIGAGINVRPRDLAMHLFKLAQQDFVTYEFRSGAVSVMLTEKGFKQVKAGMPVKPKPQVQPTMAAPGASGAGAPMAGAVPIQEELLAQDQAAMEGVPGGEQPEPTVAQMSPEEVEQKIKKSKGAKTRNMAIAVVIIVVIVVLGLAFWAGYL
ncbi:MAG: hypothetical protein LVQ95_05465 [Candidatus Micrarchaeales archaeon]|nr:hypothetical protein [Candidatus Micrarchaeales archaeon]